MARPSVDMERVHDAMVARMIFRDRVCFASKETIARDVGCSPKTIQRAWKRLEESGRWSYSDSLPSGRRVKTKVWVCHDRFVPQRLRRHNPSPSGLRSYRYGRTNALGCHAKRGEMSELDRYDTQPLGSQAGPTGDVEPVRPHTAQDIVATVVDTFSAKGIPIPSRHKGMIARQSKELLGDGFDYETVVVAAVVSLKRGQPQNLHFIASDLVLARAGERMTRREYEKALQDEMELR